MQFSRETKKCRIAFAVLKVKTKKNLSDKLPFRWGGGVAGGLATARRRASDGHGSARQGWKGSKLLAVSRCNWGLRVCIAEVTAASENRWRWISGARKTKNWWTRVSGSLSSWLQLGSVAVGLGSWSDWDVCVKLSMVAIWWWCWQDFFCGVF